MHFDFTAKAFVFCVSLVLCVVVTTGCHHMPQTSTTVRPPPIPRDDSEIKRLSKEIDDLKERVNALAQSLAAAKSDVTISQADLARMRSDLKAAETRIAELNSRNQQMAERQAVEQEMFMKSLQAVEATANTSQATLRQMQRDLQQTRARAGKTTELLRDYEGAARLHQFSIQECETEAEAQIGLLVPAHMEVGIASGVHVDITKDLSAGMRQRLTAQGFRPDTLQRLSCEARVRIGFFRNEKDASSDDFNFESVPKGRPDDFYGVDAGSLAPWDWRVTPLRPGNARAEISFETRIRAVDGPKEMIEHPTIKTAFFVIKPNRVYKMQAWIASNSTAILVGLLLSFFLWVAKKAWDLASEWRAKRKRRPAGFHA